MEYIGYAFSGINILPSVLLLIVIFYWLMTIFGFFSIDGNFLDFDLGIDFDGDVDTDVSGTQGQAFGTIVEFLNLNSIPFMIYFTILVLVWWIASMLTYYLNIATRSLIAVFLLIVNIIIAFVITKLVTEPMKKFFSSFQDKNDIKIVGKTCVLKNDISNEKIGQGEILVNGYPVIISVKTDEKFILKGVEVKIIAFYSEKNIYEVKTI